MIRTGSLKIATRVFGKGVPVAALSTECPNYCSTQKRRIVLTCRAHDAACSLYTCGSRALHFVAPNVAPRCHGTLNDFAKYLICLAPRAGFEPATNRLTAGCSTTELPGNKPVLRRRGYNKA